MNDPYETGTPKYMTAQAIYDALSTLTNAEEINILSEMFADVSYDSQEYYYTDKGYTLSKKFDDLSGYGEKMWVLDLAVWQIDRHDTDTPHLEIHDIVFDALINSDLAKRIGFKKLFIEIMMRGDKSGYDEIIEEYCAELSDLNRFEFYEMAKAWNRVKQAQDMQMAVSQYSRFCNALCDKVANLHLHKESQLIAECRALLTGYDDFMFGLRMNQHLYQEQEQRYHAKTAQLQARYDEMVRQLLSAAIEQGLVLDIEPRLLDESIK